MEHGAEAHENVHMGRGGDGGGNAWYWLSVIPCCPFPVLI